MFGDAKEPELPFFGKAKLGTQIILVQVVVKRSTFSVVDDLCNGKLGSFFSLVRQKNEVNINS